MEQVVDTCATVDQNSLVANDCVTEIFSADWVIPVANRSFRDGALAVRGDTIVDVGDAKRVRSRFFLSREMHYDECAILPGLVEGHSHSELTLHYDKVRYEDLFDLMRGVSEYRRGVDRTELKKSVNESYRRALQRGVTCMVDWRTFVDPHASDAFRPMTVMALEVIGPRPRDTKPLIDRLESALNSILSAKCSSTAVAIAPHSLYMVSHTLWRRVMEVAKSYSIPITTHVAESAAEKLWLRNGNGPLVQHCANRSGIAVLRRPYDSVIDLLESRRSRLANFVLVHGTFLSHSDLGRIQKSGGFLCLCPRSNNAVSGKIIDLQAVVDFGVRFLLGTDSHLGDHNILEEARLLLQQVPETSVSVQHSLARALVRACTLEAATAFGLEDRIGSLVPGKQADFLVLRLPSGGTVEEPELGLIREPCFVEVYQRGERVT
jgi:cytosine/adenosine deaminase-related metal-dependent hydrolase